MPYGIKNETREDEMWMMKCIMRVQSENPKYDKETCIKICKAALLRDRALSKEDKSDGKSTSSTSSSHPGRRGGSGGDKYSPAK